MMQFEIPTERPSIIKVIGVGGGGSNAVNHMFKLGIKGVDFIVCNTDHQALDKSPVPLKVQLGPGLTQGLGAGAMPEVGRKAALENIDEMKEILRHNTKMVFITAGMGGGTGTGAAPIIAAIAREMGILTVGIVTIPFGFEGKKRKAQADAGVEEMRRNVDTLLVICNDKLREIHGDLKLREAFGHADDILAIAAKSIAEIITTTLHINVDFADIQTVMKESGVAIMGSAHADGDNRAVMAVEKALHSPLLNDNSIEGARYILLNITSGNEEITMDEMTEITDHIQERAGHSAEVIMGVGTDETLGNGINVTVIATGFKTRDQLDSVISHQETVTKYDISGELIISESTAQEALPLELHSQTIIQETTTDVMEKFATDLDQSAFNEPVVYNLNEEPALDQSTEEIPEVIVGETSLPEIEIFEMEVDSEVIEPEMTLEVIDEPVSDLEPEIQMMEIVNEETSNEPFQVTFEVGQTDLDGLNDVAVNMELISEPEMDTTATSDPIFELSTETSDQIHEADSPSIVELKLDHLDDDSTSFVYIKPVDDHQEPVASTPVVEASSNESSVIDEEAKRMATDRIARIRELNMRYNTPSGLSDMEKIPAYKRRGVQFENSATPQNVEISKLSLTGENEGRPEIKPNNPFLHDRVD